MVTGTLWKQPAEAILNVAILSVFSFLKRHKVKDDSFLCYFVDVYCIWFTVCHWNCGSHPIILSHPASSYLFFEGREAWWCSRGCHCIKVANASLAVTKPPTCRCPNFTECNTEKPRQGLSIVWWRRLLCRLHLRRNQNIGQLSLRHSVTTEIVLGDASYSQNHPESFSWVQVMRYVNS